MGDFEFALVFYHRGNRLRPELQKFRLGIEKSQEAIINCIGSKMFHFTVPTSTARSRSVDGWWQITSASDPRTLQQRSLFASAFMCSVALLR